MRIDISVIELIVVNSFLAIIGFYIVLASIVNGNFPEKCITKATEKL